MSVDTSEKSTPSRARRPVWYGVATAALAGVLTVGAIAMFSGDADAPAASSPFALSLGTGPGEAKCAAVTAEILRTIPIAFEGTATAVDGEAVTLQVDRWFVGGDAATVLLHAPAGMQDIIGGIDFQVGDRYLVTATEGVVNYCGYTAPYDADLAAVFADAFSG